jgi:hypothetical protein
VEKPALTHLTTCLIEFPFSRSEIATLPRRILQGDAKERESELEAIGHEAMHFYQAVTTNFLFDISTNYFRATTEVLQAIKGQAIPLRAGAFPKLGAAFAEIEDRLWTRRRRPARSIGGPK